MSCARSIVTAILGGLTISVSIVIGGCKSPEHAYVIAEVVDPVDRNVFIRNLTDEHIRFETMQDGSLKIFVASPEELRARTAAYRKWQAVRLKAIDLDEKR